MKNFFTAISIIAMLTACEQKQDKKATQTPATVNPNGMVATPPDTTKFTTIEWVEKQKNFGKIAEGQKLEVAFKFKNTGDKPLVIYRVQPSCGCTAAEPPKEPVAPGSQGEIKATFDSKGRTGTNHKTLYVYANTKGSQDHELVFDVEVEKQ
jgi:Protein of unknown function (DUF1573)